MIVCETQSGCVLQWNIAVGEFKFPIFDFKKRFVAVALWRLAELSYAKGRFNLVSYVYMLLHACIMIKCYVTMYNSMYDLKS